MSEWKHGMIIAEEKATFHSAWDAKKAIPRLSLHVHIAKYYAHIDNN